jgi:hypothetical protein
MVGFRGLAFVSITIRRQLTNTFILTAVAKVSFIDPSELSLQRFSGYLQLEAQKIYQY